MRIWMFNHYALPPTNAGGTRHYNFARQLQKRGHEVLIIASNYSHITHSFISSDSRYGVLDNTYDVPFVWLPVPAYKRNSLARFWNMIVFSRAILKNKYLKNAPPPDVIIGSSPHLFAAFAALRLAKRLKKPFILEIRDLWPETLLDLGRFTQRHPLIKLMKWIEQYLYKQATRIISLLPSADKYLVQCGVNPANILWLPNSVDIDAIPHFSMKATENKKFTLMYAGAHGIANDLDTIIAAAKILQNKNLSQNIKICLVGDGPHKAALKKLAEKEKVTIVEFIDSIPKKEIYATLNEADAFLMLLKESPVFRWGISPNKLFDYLIMERPVIFGVKTPFNPVEKFNAGFSIKPSHPEELASAIHRLSLLPKTELQDMGKRGKQFVLEYHHLHRLTDSLEKLIHETRTN